MRSARQYLTSSAAGPFAISALISCALFALQWRSASFTNVLATMGVLGLPFVISMVHVARRLWESEARFRAVADSAPALIWMSDATGACTYFNKAYLAFTGRTSLEEEGWGWESTIHPDDLLQCKRTYLAHLAARVAYTMEYRMRRADGQWRWVLDNGGPRTGPKGEFLGLVGVAQDITMRREAEHALSAFVDAKRDFVAAMSHELRTPLSVIIASTELCADGISEGTGDCFEVPPEAKAHLDRIERASNELLALIDDVLAFRSLAHQQIDLTFAVVPTLKLVADATITLGENVLARGLRFRVSTDDAPLLVNTDGDKVRDILKHLIDNAIKFTRTGGIEVWVGGASNGHVQFEVRDSGVGIALDDMDKVFEPLYQVRQSMVREVGGLGIGLTVQQALAHALGGELTVRSEVGRGSTFTLVIPKGNVTH